MGVSTLIIVALVALTAVSIRNATYSKNKTLASRYNQEAVEWLRGERDKDFDTFVGNATNIVWCISELNWESNTRCSSSQKIESTPFVREVEFSVDTAEKTIIEANVSVAWEDSQGMHDVRSSTNFTDWRDR
ncbi:hypothetical protein ACFL1Q_00265 [Patescibacteria group bacterium]